MKRVLRLIMFLTAFAAANTLVAQNYKTAIGARLGSPLSASFKVFISESGAIEAFVNYRGDDVYSYNWKRYGFGLAYQKHNSLGIDGLEQLGWYTGGGVTAYYWTWSNDVYFDGYNNISFGLQGYLGLDYAFENVPINISLDWVPTYIFNGYVNGFGADYGAISVRYILGR